MLDPHLLECNKCHVKIIKKKKINDKQPNKMNYQRQTNEKERSPTNKPNKQSEESAHKQTNKQEDNLTKKFGLEYQKQVELHQR